MNPELELKDQELVTTIRNLFALLGEDEESVDHLIYASLESMFFDAVGNKEEIIETAGDIGIDLQYVMIDPSSNDPTEIIRSYIVIGVSCPTTHFSFISKETYFSKTETVFVTASKEFPKERFYFLLEINDDFDYVFEGTPIDLKSDTSEVIIGPTNSFLAELN